MCNTYAQAVADVMALADRYATMASQQVVNYASGLSYQEAKERADCARAALQSQIAMELQKLHEQLEAVGAGGVEPLRRRRACLVQIAEPCQQPAMAA